MSWRVVVACALCAAGQAGAGELTRRLERTLERTLSGGPPAYTQELLAADLVPDSSRLFADYSGDLSGRYLGGTALAGPIALGAAGALAPRIFDLQRADGGFGRPLSPAGAHDDDMARLWGHGRLLVGLLEYHQTTGDARSLEAARRLGDFLAAHAARFNAPAVRRRFQDGAMAHGYICWTQNVEGLALLARATGEERYRITASAIAEGVERRPGQHAHGWLSSLRGLALLAEDDSALLPRLEGAWDAFAASENLLWTGGPPEYFAPGIARDEGCASADWVRLNLDLWQLTGRERYIAAAENGLFNALFANQQPSGDFGHLKLSENGFDYGAVQAWWCCTLHGLRGLEAVRGQVFRQDGGALLYGLPVDGAGSLGELEIEADAELARDGRVTFHVRRAPAHEVKFRVRAPARTVEMRSPFGEARAHWLDIERVWERGESFSIEYGLEVDFTEMDGAMRFRAGPYTLGVSEGSDPAFFNEGFERRVLESAVTAPGDRPSRVTAPFTPPRFGGQQAAIVLRPIAERWESPGHGLRWAVRFGAAPERASALERKARAAYERRKPLALGFAVGALFAGAVLWRLRSRTASRRPSASNSAGNRS